jgi:DNA (cytosine-5)-methyltransferase 1
MSWGLEKAGFRVVGAIDLWDVALNTFTLNHPQCLVKCGDISDLSPEGILRDLGMRKGDLDCLVGGPPCQGFSKNVPATYRFLEDARNQLFREYLRFVEGVYPKVVVMENVAEIHNAYGGAVREEIETNLTALGYKVIVRVVTASDYGVPQSRRRCLVFGSRTNTAPRFPSPTHGRDCTDRFLDVLDPYVSAWDAISDLPEIENGGGQSPMGHVRAPLNGYQSWARQGCEIVYDHVAKDLKPTQLARYRALEPGQGLKNLPDDLRPKSGYSGAYGRLDFICLAPTITRWVFHPGSGRYGHPSSCRIITMREAARLQSFTDDFKFAGSYNDKAGQIGNAVPPRLMYAMAPEITRCLGLPH